MINITAQIELFGGLRVQLQDQLVTRFLTHKISALLAYLALNLRTFHSREYLIELFWSDLSPEAGRNSLRIALSSLRHQLEPPGVPAGAILIADRVKVQLNPEAVTTDVAAFESALQSAALAADRNTQIRLLKQAVDLYQGDLLPGSYEDWIVREQARLADRYIDALQRLTGSLESIGDLAGALDYAHRMVLADRFREESHRTLMRLYASLGRPVAALEAYQELNHLLKDELNASPSASTRELAALLQRNPRAAILNSEGATPPFPAHVPSPREPAPSPPPARIGKAPTLALPASWTRCYGREAEAAQLERLLREEEARLVTLTGPAGVGKTRLAQEVARRVSCAFGDRIWSVSLAETAGPDRIGEAIRAALRLSQSSPQEVWERVADRLGCAPALLVLDDFESLVDSGAALLRTLQERAPALTCLVTSRQPLGLAGEHEFPVEPLPSPSGPGAPEWVCGFAAVQLFLDRARAVRPDFQVTARNAAAIAELCRRLEGLPLALELAALWTKTLSPAKLLERLASPLDLLVSRRRDRPQRHQSLRAAFAWSYDRLPEAIQRFFAGLSVFRGGWSLEAAEAVGREPQALSYLAVLQDVSLVTMSEQANEPRYRFLEPLRVFSAERLQQSGEMAAWRDRHLAYFLALAEQADAGLSGAQWEAWRIRLETERENLDAARAWYYEAGQMPEPGVERRLLFLEAVQAYLAELTLPSADLPYEAGARDHVLRSEEAFAHRRE